MPRYSSLWGYAVSSEMSLNNLVYCVTHFHKSEQVIFHVLRNVFGRQSGMSPKTQISEDKVNENTRQLMAIPKKDLLQTILKSRKNAGISMWCPNRNILVRSLVAYPRYALPTPINFKWLYTFQTDLVQQYL